MAKLNRRWGDLQHVVNLVREVELGKLADIEALLDKQNRATGQLRQQRQSRAQDIRGLDCPDQAQMAGADALWAVWMDREIRRQNLEKAKTMSRFETQLVRARQAFGRSEAAKSIAKKLLK